MRDHKQNHRCRWKQSNHMLSVDVISGYEMCLYCMKIDLHPLWHGWVHAQKNLRIHFYLIYILTEKVPLRKALGTETLCQFWKKLNFIGTNATQMQLVHNNLFHFLYYNSIINFFDSMNMTATHPNNHPTPNLNLLQLWPDRCLKVKVVKFDLEFFWPSSGLSCGPTGLLWPLMWTKWPTGTFLFRTTSFLDIRKCMWNYQSSSRSSIPRDRWRVSACPPPEGEGVHWWSSSEVVLPAHRRPTHAASRNGWPGPRLRPEPDQHTLCLQSLLHWKKEHGINLWKQLSIKSNWIFRQCLPVSQAGQTSTWFNHRVHLGFHAIQKGLQEFLTQFLATIPSVL